MVKGKTKSGIKYQIDERVRDDARLLYLFTRLDNEEVKKDTKQASDLLFKMFAIVFGTDQKLMEFMNAVAEVHDGVCTTEILVEEMHEMFEALDVKNS